MPARSSMLMRGLLKLAAVVAGAGILGALFGIGLAKITEDGDADALTGAATAPVTTATSPSTSTATSPSTATATAPAPVYRTPIVDVRSARLGATDAATGRAPVTVAVHVVNRTGRALKAPAPQMLTGQEKVPLEPPTDEARPLLRALAPGAAATGILRFIPSPAATLRLQANPRARLSIVRRIVQLELTTEAP